MQKASPSTSTFLRRPNANSQHVQTFPMSDNQLLAIASSMAVLASNHFPQAIDKWESLPRANKMWPAWKTHYRAAHITQKWQLLASSKTTPSAKAANAVMTVSDNMEIGPETFTPLDGYLDNLAVVASNKKK